MSECEHTTRLIYGDGKCPVRERVKVLEDALDEAEKALEKAHDDARYIGAPLAVLHDIREETGKALRSIPSTERSLAVLAQNEAAKSLADLVVGEGKCWDAMEHRKRIDQYEGAKANVEAIDRVARLKETRP